MGDVERTLVYPNLIFVETGEKCEPARGKLDQTFGQSNPAGAESKQTISNPRKADSVDASHGKAASALTG